MPYQNTRRIIFDLDDTLIETTALYLQARDNLAEYINSNFDTSYTADEITGLQESIDVELVKEHGFSTDRFALSFEDTLLQIAKNDSFTVSLSDMTDVREIAKSVSLTPEEYAERGWKGEARFVLESLSEEYELALLTKGEPELQRKKVDALSITDWIPEEDIHICNRKTPEMFEEALDGVPPEEAWKIGDSIKSDINPMLESGGNAINISGPKWAYEESEVHPNPSGDFYAVETPSEILDIL